MRLEPARPWLIAAALVVAASAAVYFTRPSTETPPAARESGRFPVMPPPPEPAAPEGIESPPSHLLEAGGAAVEREEQAIDALLDALAGHSTGPEAKAKAKEITQEFAKQPKLKKAYRDYMARPAGSRPPRRQFLESLKAVPEFRQLAARFASGGMSSSTAGSQPRSTPAGKQGSGASAGLGARASEGARRVDPHEVARQWARKAVSNVRLDNLTGALGKGARPPYSSAGGAYSGPSLGSGDAPEKARPATTASAPAAEAAGPAAGRLNDNKAITRLEKPKDPVSEKMRRLLELYPFLADNFSEAELRTLVDAVDANDGSLWGACFTLSWFARCLGACNTAAPIATGRQTSCSLPGGTSWNACMDSFGEELKCIRTCNTQSPCYVSDEVWDRRCLAPLRLTPPQSPPAECLGGSRQPALPSAAPAASAGPCSARLAVCGGPAPDCCSGLTCVQAQGSSVSTCDVPEAALSHDGGCQSGWLPPEWVQSNDGGRCLPVCMQYCEDPDMGRSATCPGPRPASQPLCSCNAVPCQPGEQGMGPPGGCKEIGGATCYYGAGGNLLTCVPGRKCG